MRLLLSNRGIDGNAAERTAATKSRRGRLHGPGALCAPRGKWRYWFAARTVATHGANLSAPGGGAVWVRRLDPNGVNSPIEVTVRLLCTLSLKTK